MYSGVLREVTGVGERFAALGTLVGLGLPHMDLGVQLKIGLRTENLEKTEKNSLVKKKPVSSVSILCIRKN